MTLDWIRNLAVDALVILAMIALWTILMVSLKTGSWSNVLLYNGVVNALLTILLFSLLVFKVQKHRSVDTKILLLSNGGFLLMLLLVLGPVAIDRSLSLYILNEIDLRGGTVNQKAIDKMIFETYPLDMNVREQRVTEQVSSGNLKRIPSGELTLTSRGKYVLRATDSIRSSLDLNPLSGRAIQNDEQ